VDQVVVDLEQMDHPLSQQPVPVQKVKDSQEEQDVIHQDIM
jgi:hypothetical protein